MDRLNKSIRLTAFFCTFSTLVVANNTIPDAVKRAIPRRYNLEDPKFASSRKELEELIKDCGPGIVDGAKTRSGKALENRCDYTVKMDDLFFEDIKNKTGLLPQKDWAYDDYVSWVTPRRLDVPETFDLRDLMKNGQPEIKKQQCGDCWAWSTHHGLEIVRAVHDQKVFDHSVQTVLSCSGNGSCSGGYMSVVGFLTHGLPMEDEFPYAGYDKSCPYSSSEIKTGWTGKVIEAPYVGNSLNFSRAKRQRDGSYREGTKIGEMTAAMYQWQSPLVVTVSAFSISGGGVVSNCSAINSGGNHMVAVVGWDETNGNKNAHVWNSWGPDHGENGVSRIKWECGTGKLNHGLGMAARVLNYKAPCTPPNAGQLGLHEIKKGASVQIGAEQTPTTNCQWTPSEGLDDATACVTNAHPAKSTEYHLTATNDCGTASSMTLVDVWGREGGRAATIVTPFGVVPRD